MSKDGLYEGSWVRVISQTQIGGGLVVGWCSAIAITTPALRIQNPFHLTHVLLKQLHAI